jgi:hypothetical protein
MVMIGLPWWRGIDDESCGQTISRGFAATVADAGVMERLAFDNFAAIENGGLAQSKALKER